MKSCPSFAAPTRPDTPGAAAADDVEVGPDLYAGVVIVDVDVPVGLHRDVNASRSRNVGEPGRGRGLASRLQGAEYAADNGQRFAVLAAAPSPSREPAAGRRLTLLGGDVERQHRAQLAAKTDRIFERHVVDVGRQPAVSDRRRLRRRSRRRRRLRYSIAPSPVSVPPLIDPVSWVKVTVVPERIARAPSPFTTTRGSRRRISPRQG